MMTEWLIAFVFLLSWLIRLAPPIILVALATLLLIGLKRRRRDRAIRLLDGFPVVLEREDGSRRSGVLRVHREGLTLEYALPATGRTPPVPIAYLHYEAEWKSMNAIYRFDDELSKLDRELRQKQLEFTLSPRPRKRSWRSGQWIDRLTDGAIALWAHLHGEDFPNPTFLSLPHGHSVLTGLAGDSVNNMLEQKLGKQVVVRHYANNALHRHQGVLAAYSRYFLFLARTPVSQQVNVRLRPEKGAGQEWTLRWQWKEGKLEIRNLSAYPLLLDHIRVGEQVQDMSMMIAPESAFTLRLEAPARGNVTLAARIVREGDMLLPRNRAIVRYAADLPDFLAALEVGVTLAPPEERDEEIVRLQRELKKRPDDPATAAALARRLLQQGKLDEAERYYRQALRHARSLPDGGERVQLELAQLKMYREDGGGLAS